jgi:hypothetical protein
VSVLTSSLSQACNRPRLGRYRYLTDGVAPRDSFHRASEQSSKRYASNCRFGGTPSLAQAQINLAPYVGSGQGGFLAEVLKAYPTADGTLYDLPQAVQEPATQAKDLSPTHQRCRSKQGEKTSRFSWRPPKRRLSTNDALTSISPHRQRQEFKTPTVLFRSQVGCQRAGYPLPLQRRLYPL